LWGYLYSIYMSIPFLFYIHVYSIYTLHTCLFHFYSTHVSILFILNTRAYSISIVHTCLPFLLYTRVYSISILHTCLFHFYLTLNRWVPMSMFKYYSVCKIEHKVANIYVQRIHWQTNDVIRRAERDRDTHDGQSCPNLSSLDVLMLHSLCQLLVWDGACILCPPQPAKWRHNSCVKSCTSMDSNQPFVDSLSFPLLSLSVFISNLQVFSFTMLFFPCHYYLFLPTIFLHVAEAASQVIPCPLGNLKVHYRVRNSPPMVPIL